MSQDPKSKLASNGTDFTKTSHHDTYDFSKPEQFDLEDTAVLITGASKGVRHIHEQYSTSISTAR